MSGMMEKNMQTTSIKLYMKIYFVSASAIADSVIFFGDGLSDQSKLYGLGLFQGVEYCGVITVSSLLVFVFILLLSSNWSRILPGIRRIRCKDQTLNPKP